MNEEKKGRSKSSRITSGMLSKGGEERTVEQKESSKQGRVNVLPTLALRRATKP